MVESIKKFTSDVSLEMKKVTWPTKEQLKESTAVVLIVTLIITIVVFAMDSAVGKAIELIF
jgi:preprotein translocase subunit SecE